ncbi:MAG: hypothetical protein KF785_09965 [Gemmatimonadales bacterium]|nr:hypothetical protein [Gemmatimonadales bacterium]
MNRWFAVVIGGIMACNAPALSAQAQSQTSGAALSGTWELEKGNVKAEGPKTVVIRPDSSASWGKETVRWRLRSDQIMIALGGEWEVYTLRVRGQRLTLSGGDLPEPITLRRVGPPTPRPAGTPVPPDPDVI